MSAANYTRLETIAWVRSNIDTVIGNEFYCCTLAHVGNGNKKFLEKSCIISNNYYDYQKH